MRRIAKAVDFVVASSDVGGIVEVVQDGAIGGRRRAVLVGFFVQLVQVDVEPDVENLNDQYVTVLREEFVEDCEGFPRELRFELARPEIHYELIVFDVFQASHARKIRYQLPEDHQLLIVDVELNDVVRLLRRAGKLWLEVVALEKMYLRRSDCVGIGAVDFMREDVLDGSHEGRVLSEEVVGWSPVFAFEHFDEQVAHQRRQQRLQLLSHNCTFLALYESN